MSESARGRREDLRLLTGQGKFTSDWSLPGQAFGVFLRADRAHARIISIDAGAAESLPGVLAVITGADLEAAGLGAPSPINPGPGRNGFALKNPHRHALAHEKVRFAGEPVVLVVAESEAAAQDGAEAIVIDYEDLPVVVTAEQALAKDAPQIHSDVDGNLGFDFEAGDRAKTDAAFAAAAHVVKMTLDAHRIAGVPMEPKACAAAHDAARGVTDVYMQTQGMADIQTTFGQIFGAPRESFRIHALDVGGAFGIRGEVYPENIAIVFAARKLGRPVKWTGSRSETFVSDHHGRAALMTGELAIDKDGNFIGYRVQWLVNMGAFTTSAGPLINTVASPRSMTTNVYRVPAAHVHNRLVYTNTTPTTAYRGAGRPNVTYLWERLVDEAARKMGVDRIELRRRNLIQKDGFPYTTAIGGVYDSGDPPGLLDQVLQVSDWQGFAQRRAQSQAKGLLRGIGCAVFIEPSGSVGQEEIAIRFDGDGKLTFYTLAGPSGQGYESVYPEIVANVLGIDPDGINTRSSDPDGPSLTGTGSFGSRSLISHGSALFRGAEDVAQKGLELAAQDLEVAVADLVFEGGLYKVKGTDLAIGFADLARKHAKPGSPHPLDTTMKVPVAAAFPSGGHVAEVEIDPDTGVTEILSYAAVDDCGVIYNHTIVEGQLLGGLMQGLGQVMGEACVYDPETGQMLSGSFMDYMMPRADDLPLRLSLHNRPVPSPTNPLGAKGAGEAGTTGAIPTLANAVLDALASAGVKALDMPYTPARVWAAIQAAK
ncbi:MAG: xanthine dehydrogenase family protein molybdopterin-binding subunit [Hyphomicrobiaceae bacterium]